MPIYHPQLYTYKKTNYIKLYSDQGATGWGRASYSESDKDSLMESVLGKSVGQLIIPSEGIVPNVDRAFDFALHDLAGVILELPVYKMLGASGPREKEVYSGMIYFDELYPE